MVNIYTHKPNIITLNRMAMRLGFLRSKILILLLVLVAWQVEVEGKTYNSATNACGGGFIMGSSLHNITPNSVPSGLRDKGTWTVPAGLSFSNLGQNPEISGFVQGASYVITWTSHNDDIYNYTVSVPVSGSTFNLEYSGSTDPVLMDDTENYPVLLEVDPPAGSNYSFFYQDVNTKTVFPGLTGVSSNYNFTPADPNRVYGVYANVTEIVAGVTCRSQTNVIQVAKENVVVQVIGGKSVCDGDFNFLLEVIPFSPSLFYEWSVPGGVFINGQTVDVSAHGAGTYSVTAYRNPSKTNLISTSDNVVVGGYVLSSVVAPVGIVGLCDGNSVSLTGAGTSTPITGNPIDYDWIRNGVSGYASGSGTSSTISVNTSGEFVYKIYETNNPLCYAMSAPKDVQLTIDASPMPVSGSNACVGSSINNISLSNSEVGVTYRLMHNDGSGPVMVQEWMSGANGQTHNFTPVTAVGSYTVEATGCSGVVTMTGGPFVISALPTVFNIATPSPACVGSSLTLSGVETDVVYFLLRNSIRTGAFIDGSVGSVVFGGLSAGDYTVEAERNGCVQPMNGTLRIQATPQQFTLTTNKNSYCSGVANTGVELSLGGSQSGLKYQLQRDNGGGYADYGTAVDGTGVALISAWQNIPDGTYRVVARTSAGCTNNMTGRPVIIETIPPSAGISTSNPNSRCVGSTVDFYINVSLSGAQPFSFDILNNIGEPVISVSNRYDNTYSVKVDPASNATYTLTNLTDASSCEPELNIGQVQFFVRPLPVFNFSSSPNSIGLVAGVPSTSICSGSQVTLEMNVSNTSGPYQYSWNQGSISLGNAKDVTFPPNATRTYDATVRNEYGCQDTKQVEVVVNTLPVIDFNLASGSNEVCENEGTVSLVPVAPNNGGAFSGPGVSGNFFDPAAAGASLIPHNISYTFQNTTNGCANTITKPIIVHPEPNVSVLGNQTNFCADQLTGTISGNPQNSNGIWVLAAGARPWFGDNGNGRANINITGALADAGESSYTADYIYTDPTTGCVSDGNYLTFNVRDDLSNNVDFRLSGGGAIPATLCQDDSDIDLEAFFVNTGVVIADGTFSGPGISDNGNGTAIFSPDDAGTGTHVINYNYTDPATQCNGNASHSVQIGTTLTFNGGLSPIYCKEDAAFPIFGDPGPGTLEIFFEIEATARFTQLNNSSTNQFTITPAAAAWESGDYTAVFTYSDGCDNVIEYDFTISDALDATFTVKDNQVQFCVTQNANPYDNKVELIPAQNGGTFTINTPSGDGVEPNGTSFYPDVAQPGNYIITYTIQTGACSATYSLPVVVVGNPLVSISNLSDSYCENSPDFSISASNLPIVAGASYTFSATANAAGRVPIYETTKGDLDTPKEIDDTNVNFSPSYVGPGTYFITYIFDNTANTGCVSTFVKEVEILEAPGVDFGVTDPVSGATLTTLEFCQSASPLVLAGDIFTDPGNPLSSGTGFFTGVGVDNLFDGTGDNGRASFDPSLVSPTDVHSIVYEYTNYNGCQTQRTRDFKILAAPIDHYKVVSDPASGIYCFEAPPVDPTIYGVQIGLEYTQPNVTYHLLLDGVATGQTLAGRADGASAVFTNRVTDEGTYTVRAVLDAVPPTSACEAIMSGSVEVRRNYVTGTIDELIHESCAGVADGFIKMSAGGGTAPYVFTLTDGTNTFTSATGEFLNLEPGNYAIKIVDNVGCEWNSASGATLNSGSALTLNSIPTSVIQLTCNGVNNASFTVEAGGLGSSNYEFRRDPAAPWVSHGSDTYTFSDLAAGTYVVSVRDADNPGCQASETVVIDPEPAAITLVNPPAVTPVGCSETPIGAIVLRAQGGIGSGPFNYVLYELKPWGDWVPIKVESENIGVDAIFSGLNGGEYRVDITDANGCGPLQVPITIDAAASSPVVQLSGDGIVHVSQPGFSDGSIQIAITGGEVPYNIVWSGLEPDGITPITGLVNNVYRQENLAAGTYKVEVTDDNNCPAELPGLQVVENPDFEIVATKSNPGPCYGSINGEINLGITGGVLPYQSLTLTNSSGTVLVPHSSGNSFANYNNLPAGNYTAVAIDDRGVSVSEPIELEGPTAPLQLTYSKADATCFGGDGSVEFSATGGTPTTGTPNTYTYSIIPTSGIPLTGNLDEGGSVTRNLPAGNYQLTVTDGVTCFDAVTFTINEPSQMGIVVEDVQNIKCFGGIDGEITVSVNGRPGGTAFTYEWQRYDEVSSSWQPDTETTATITDHAAGSYRVRAFEPGNPTCFSVWSGSISISQPLAAMVVTHTVNDITTCHGDNSGSIVLSVTGGTAPYIIKLGTNEYSWDGLNPYVLSGLSVGSYNIEVVDDSGCKQLITEPIADPELFDVTNIDYGIECENLTSGYFTASIRGGLEASDGSYSYRVVAIRQNNIQVYDNTVYSYTPTLVVPEYALSIPDLIAGNYTIRITDDNSSDPTACLFEQHIELRNITVSANVIAPTCLGADNGSIELTVEGGSGNYDFSWTDLALNPISTDQNIYGLEPGTYIVTILDIDEACSFTREYTIAYQNTLSVNEVVSDVTCHGGSDGSITATANGGVAPYNYLWAKFDGTNYIPIINTQTISGQTIGTYKVTVTDFNGCQVSKEDIEIEQPDDFTISSHVINNHVDCYGGANGSFTVVPDRVDNFEYSIDGINWQVSPTFTNLEAGGYQVSMRDRDRPGPDYCAKYDIKNVIITEPEALAVSLDETTNVSCFNGNDGAIEVTVSGGPVAGDYDYQWYRVTGTGNMALSLGSVNPATTLTAGDYRVRVTDDNLCSIWSDVYTVTEPSSSPTITVVANNSVTTPGGNDGSITISISGGTPGYSINWTGPGGYTASGAASIFNLEEGTYTASVLDSKGCPVTRNITVSEPGTALQLSVLSSVDPVLCPVAQSGSIELEATGGKQPYTFTLTKRPGIAVTTGIVSANYITYSGLDAGIYDARVVDDNGVAIEVTGTTLEVPDALDLSIVNKKDVVCFGESNGEISFTAEGGTLSDNGTAGDPSDDYHTYVIVSEVGLPSYSGQIIDGDTEIISTLPAGDYSLTVTDSKGCSATTDFTVSQPEDLSISVDNISPVTCNGGNNGAIVTTVNGRPGGTLFTYSWEYSTDQSTWNAYAGTSLLISGLEAGWYRITATETATSCSVTSSEIQINEPAAVGLSIVKENDITTCHGDDSGSIVLSVSGGTAPYMVKYGTVEETWSGLNNYVAAGLVAGDYTFEITDNQGCFVEESATITEPITPFVASVAGSGIACETPNTGWIDLSVSGGVDSNGALAGGFSYGVQVIRQENNQIFLPTLNDPVAGVIEIDNLPAGTYTIRVWDGNSTAPDRCGKTFEVELRNMVVNANVKHPSCTGLDNGRIEAIVTGGSGNFSYAWTGPGTFTSTAPLIENLEPGSYELTVTDNINSCSSAPRTYIINYAYTLAVTTNVTDVSCYGGSNGSAIASPSGGTMPYFYLWERQNGASWLPLTNTATLSNRAADTYRVTVTDANNCETTSANVTIGQPDDFDIDPIIYNRDTVSCNGGADGSFEVQVSGGSGNFEYSLDAVNWQILPTFDNLAAGSYRISIRDMDQPAPYCAKYEVETATIEEANPIVISLANQVNIDCFGDNSGSLSVSVLGGTAPYTYQWYVITSSGNIPLVGEINAILSNRIKGDYFVRVKDNNSCPATSDVYTITQPASPIKISEVSTQNVTVNGGSNGSITIAISGGTPGYTINWFEGDDNTGAGLGHGLVQGGLKEGNYTVEVFDNATAPGCSTTETFTITQPNTPLSMTETLTHPEPCFGATNGGIELDAKGGTLPYTFTVIRNPGTEITAFSVSGNKAFYNGLAAGFYTARVRDNNGNVMELPNLELTQPLPVEIYDITPTNITCFGENDGSIEFSIRGGTPHATNGYSYILRPENGSDIIGSGTTKISVPVLISDPGLAPDNYTLMVFDASNVCFAEQSFTLTQPDEIVINETIIPVSCHGEANGSIRIEVSGGIGGGYTYEWFVYNTITSSWDAIAGSNTVWLQNRAAGRYKVEVTEMGVAGCSKESADFELSEPDYVFSIKKTEVKNIETCSADNAGIIQVELEGGTMPYTVTLSDGVTPIEKTLSTPQFTFPNLFAGTYTLTVKDAANCAILIRTVAVTAPAPIKVENANGTIDCKGANDGEITFDLSGGLKVANVSSFAIIIEGDNGFSYSETHNVDWNVETEPYSYSYNGGTGLSPAIYTVKVWDAAVTSSSLCPVPAFEQKITLHPILITGTSIPNACAVTTKNIGAIRNIQIKGTSDNPTWKYDAAPSNSVWYWDETATGGDPVTDNTQLNQENLPVGEYILVVKDNGRGGCEVRKTFIVSAQSTLEIKGNAVPISCFGEGDGLISGIEVTGTFNYSYNWTGSGVDNSLVLSDGQKNLEAGIYGLSITDIDNGCQVSKSFEITEPGEITYDLVETVESCSPYRRGINLNLPVGETRSFNYTWTGTDGVVGNTQNLTGLKKGGQYSVIVSEYSCHVPKSISIADTVKIKTDVTQLDCFGDANGVIAVPEITGGSGNFSYVWTKNGAPHTSGTDISDININGLSFGVYELTLTDNGTSDGGGACEYVVPVTLKQPALIEAKLGNIEHITCNGAQNGVIKISVSGGTAPYTYIWTTIDGVGLNKFSQNQSGLSGGTYTVQVKDAKGCVSAETPFIVDEVDPIDFDLTRTKYTDCDGTDGELTISGFSGGSGNYKYLWSTNGGSGIIQDQLTQQSLTGGTYTIKVWDEDYPACFIKKQATLTKAITIVPTVTNQTCNSNANGSIDIAVTGGVAPYTYEWTPAVGITNINQASQSNLTKGTYELKVTDSRPVADGGPCDLTIDVDVDLDYDIQADVNVNHVSCKGGNNGSISLTKVTGAMAGNYAFLWTGLPVGKVPTNKNQSGLPAGFYKVKITDKNSDCFIEKTIQITEPPTAVTIKSIAKTDIDCKGGASGTIEVVAEGGTPFIDAFGNPYYKYAWAGPGIGLAQDFPDQTNLTAGIYTVSVIDSKGITDGCVAFSGNIVVTEPNLAIAASVVNITPVSAKGGSNGAIQLSTSGGSGSLHYAWSGMAFDGVTPIPVAHIGTNPTGLIAGKYSVIITDDKGCSFPLENIIVEEPGLPLSMEVAAKDIQPCNGSANGEIHIDAFGGTSPYTITLFQGATIINEVVANQMNEVGLSQGVYVVRIKDANNVVITKNDVEILEPAPLQLSASVSPHVLCTGSKTGSLSYTIAGGSAPYSVLVTGPGSYRKEAIGITADTYDLDDLAAGTYRILMIDNNSGNGTYLLHENCYEETTVTITEPKALVTISDNSTICKGESTNIRLSVSNYSGDYPLRIKLSDSSTKTMASANQTFVVNPVEDTEYTITEVLDNAGTCIQGSGAGSALVTVNDIPSAHIELIGDSIVCLGEEISFSIHFEGEGPFNVSYTNGTVQTNLNNILAKDTLIKVVPLESTSYKITAMSDANCTGTVTGAANVVVNELPSVTMDIAPDDAVICKGGSSEIRFNFPTGTADYRVSFTENGVLRSINAIPLVAGSYVMSVSPKVTTAYKLISVRDANNCEVAVNEVTQTITVNESPKSAGDIMGKTIVCQGEQLVTYKVDSIGFADSYVWYVPPTMGIIASQNDTIITINFKDDFVSGSISVKGKNDCGEGVAFVLPITTKKLPLKPDKPSGITSMCAGSTGLTYSIPAVDYAIKYEWLLPIGFKYANDDSTGTSILVDVKEGYTDFVGDISVIAINNCGTSEVSDTLTVTVNPFPIAVADKGNLSNRACGSTYKLNAVGPGAGYTGVWSSNRNIGTGLVTTGQENISTASIYNLSQGANAFIWTVTNTATGCSTSDEVIIYNDQVTVFAVADNYTVCDGKVNLTGSPNGSVGAPGVWAAPNGVILTPANTASTAVTNMARGENTFTWTIQKGACPSTATVKVFNNEPTEAVIKNAAGVPISIQDLPCGDDFTTLKASVPVIGEETGYWRVESGSVQIDNFNNSDIQLTKIPSGDHILSWNILNGSCVSTTTVKIRNNKFTVDAGKDEFTCDGSIQLNATDTVGGAKGVWTVIEGSGVFDDAEVSSTEVRNLSQAKNGRNVFRWTLDRHGCKSSDEVTITNNQPSKAEIQGVKSTDVICDDKYSLEAVKPLFGKGTWTVVKGEGIFENDTVHNTLVRGIENGENEYRWTVRNQTCFSTVLFTVTNLHVDVSAGSDTAVCGTSAQLHASPAVGSWSIVPGKGSGIFRPASGYSNGSKNPNAIVESLSSKENKLVWTVSNEGCTSTDTVVVSNNAPTPVSAEPGGDTPNDYYELKAIKPVLGNGKWTLREGRGTIINDTSHVTNVENLFPYINLFRWTVTYLNCSDYVDVEVLSGDLADAHAGLHQPDLCENFTSLEANLPPNTTGEWSVVTGKGGVQFENDDRKKPKVNIYDISPGRNVLMWTLKFAGSGTQSKSDTVVIINNKPSDAYAGYDIIECGDNTQLNAQEPEIGKVFWTILSGGGTFSDDTIAKPTVTNLAPGKNILKYQIQNKMCFSYDTLEVFNYEPSEAFAGEDQVVCTDSAEIRPTIPKYGEGSWRVIKGAGKGKNSKGEYTDIQGNYVYGLAPGENIFSWDVQVPGAPGGCIKSDRITIVNNQPSVSYAGPDRSSKCMDEVTLSGSTPLNNSKGTWTLISGSGEIADSSLTNTLVTKLGLGKNRFRWTVDKNGCTSISEVEIANNFIASLAGDPQINCADTAALQANNPSPGIGSWGVKGGSGSAQFSNNADPYTIVRNLDKGENILTWTINHKDCPSVSEVKIINNAPSKADAGDNKSSCENTFVLGASDPETGTGVWTIRSGGGKFEDELGESTKVDSLKFGDNIFRWTVEHEGCYSSDDVQISFNKIEAKVAGDQDICSDRVFLEANSAVPGVGTWTVIGGGSQAKFVNSHDPLTQAFDLARGKNQLKWTINNKGCITSKEVVITNHMPGTAYAGNTQEFCRDSTVLDATPIAAGMGKGKWEILTGSAILLDSEITKPKAKITGLSKGENVLRWTVTSDNGLCDSKDDVRIINNLPSIPYAGASEEYCSPTVVLKAAPVDFGTGRWSIEEGGGDLNDPALPNAIITNLKEGKNILRWTVSQGQCFLISDIEVINNTPSTANAGPDIDDCKDYATLDANMPVQGNGIGGWTLTSGNAEFKEKLNPKTLVSNLTFGQNILRWNIQKGKCISSDEITVNNNVPDQAKAGTNRETCESYLTLNANDPTTGKGSWLVLSGNGKFDDPHSPISIVRDLKLGENKFKWVVSYGSCSTEDVVEIISNKAAPYAGEDDISYTPNYDLKASNPGKLGAMWSLVAGEGSFEDETFYNTRVDGLKEGINTFRWLMDINGCVTFDDVSIDYRVVPDASFKVDTFQGCYPLMVQFTNQSIGGLSYSWDFGNDRYSSDRNPVHTFREPGEYMVTLTAPGPDNVNGTYQMKILVHDHPTADFTYGPDVLYVPGDVLMAKSHSVDADKYLWDFGDGGTSNQVNPAYKYTEKGFYTIKLKVTSVDNCVDEMVKVNAVEVKAEGFIVFPNAFTPRPDGGTTSTVGGGETNTVFRPVSNDVVTYKLQIFNRWGQLIYEGQDIDEGWNGFFNGQLSPQAVYVYKATGTFVSGREFNESGSVLLVR